MWKMRELGGEKALFKRCLLELKSLVAWWFLLSCKWLWLLSFWTSRVIAVFRYTGRRFMVFAGRLPPDL